MAGEKYSNMDIKTTHGFLSSAMEARGGDGDTGCAYPRSDAEDMSRGVRFIPGAVTMARRAGKKVTFVATCGRNCWYWEMPDGSRIYHYDPMTYKDIGTANGRKQIKTEFGGLSFEGGPGPCPQCGNVNTSGGRVKI